MEEVLLLTAHAKERIAKRGITAEEMLAALSDKRPQLCNGGTVHYFDPNTKVRVIVAGGRILTAYKVSKRFRGKGVRQ